jgi:mRNA interferase RelE/StbE
MSFTVCYLESVVQKDIPCLAISAKGLIKYAIEERLTHDPIAYGKHLRYGLYGQRRLRVSDYRIIYTVDYDNRIVMITDIGHRSKIYDD